MLQSEPNESTPLIPAITSHSGRYTHVTDYGEEWEYVYDINNISTKGECRVGRLGAGGLQREIAAAKPGDQIQTPWGSMLRVPDGRYERGFLLERTPGQLGDLFSGTPLSVPPGVARKRWDLDGRGRIVELHGHRKRHDEPE
jgi:hypothetical protein